MNVRCYWQSRRKDASHGICLKVCEHWFFNLSHDPFYYLSHNLYFRPCLKLNCRNSLRIYFRICPNIHFWICPRLHFRTSPTLHFRTSPTLHFTSPQIRFRPILEYFLRVTVRLILFDPGSLIHTGIIKEYKFYFENLIDKLKKNTSNKVL